LLLKPVGLLAPSYLPPPPKEEGERRGLLPILGKLLRRSTPSGTDRAGKGCCFFPKPRTLNPNSGAAFSLSPTSLIFFPPPPFGGETGGGDGTEGEEARVRDESGREGTDELSSTWE